MAAKASKQAPIGSVQWLQNEREQIAQFEGQENEDFAFAARNEFDWLNEHMAEIFSHNNFNVTEVFKTPGKLRGKTPRTARKKNALEARAPLTDVFAADIRYNASPNRLAETGKKLRIQSPDIAKHPRSVDLSRADAARAQTHDSGYYGTSQDEMEVDGRELALEPGKSSRNALPDQRLEVSEERRTTEGSFHSARENAVKETPVAELPTTGVPGSFPRDTPVLLDEEPPRLQDQNATQFDNRADHENQPPRDSPSSDASTPDKPLVRKASLNFASLPAREPLTTKKSIGHRTSNMDAKNQAFSRTSYFGRFTGGKSLGPVHQPGDSDEMDVDSSAKPSEVLDAAKLQNKSYTQRLHERINLLGKAPAPRSAKSIIASAAPAAGFVPQPESYTNRADVLTKGTSLMEEAVSGKTSTSTEGEDDDWTLPPIKGNHDASRPLLSKSRSVDVMEQLAGKINIDGEALGLQEPEREAVKDKAPIRSESIQQSASAMDFASPSQQQQHLPIQQKAISVSNPSMVSTESTTPAGSPSRLQADGHLSASKSKLQSIMRSARGLFTSSAGISAQAKLEALSPSSSRIRLGGIDEILNTEAAPSEQLYPNLDTNLVHALRHETAPAPTRGSPEGNEKRERPTKDLELAETEDAKSREKEREKARELKDAMDTKLPAPSSTIERTLENTSKPIRQSPRRMQQEEEKADLADPDFKPNQSMGPPARPQSQLAKPKDSRRPVKPSAKPAAKPPQVAIRIGTGSQRIPLNNTTLASSLQDSLAPVAKQPGIAKKASNTSIQTTVSVQSFKSSTSANSSKPKSVVVAAQRKEQAEKEAQRKEDEKRERERKRVAAQEEVQRKEREQRQREEAERQKERERVAAEEAKRRAQKDAADKKRVDASRKAQPSQQDVKRAGNEFQQSVRGDQAPQRPPSRQDQPSRPPSRLEKMEEVTRVPPPSRPINPAKPIKRVFDPDNDEEQSRPSRPQLGQSYQQTGDKRRRTGEEDEPRTVNRPTLQPPIRQSNMRKMQMSISHDQGFGQSTHGGQKPSMFNSSYVNSVAKVGGTNAAGHPQHGPSMQPIRVGHPMDMAKYQNGKIPFADAPNPPAAAYKTPGPSKPAPSMAYINKSSPMYTNGENIHLDEIPTDSEDEDSEDERDRKQALPDWVRTPSFFDHLAGQEQLNPDVVFGPIAPLNMEEMFKDKSRHHRFRNRTSSANWFGADRLTEDDIKQDHAAREKLRQDGGWSYGL